VAKLLSAPQLILAIMTLTLLGLFQGCSTSTSNSPDQPPTNNKPSKSDLIGTWQVIFFNAPDPDRPHLFDQAVFIRFLSDGTCALWPAPAPGGTRLRYKIFDGVLSFPGYQPTTNPQTADEPKRISITAGELRILDGDSETLLVRVPPNFVPGQSP
jgi:hypothetical protein